VHVTAMTSTANCAPRYDNTASVVTSNDGSPSQSATTACLPASVTVTKTADAPSVSAGEQIGFTVTIHNGGTGTAHGVTLTDLLPGGTPGPVHWVIDGSTGNPAAFAISGADGSQSLTLAGQPIDLAAGATLTVHVTAMTSTANCAPRYDNTASVVTSNDGSPSQSATTACLPASIHILKTADKASVNAGDSIGFTVTVSNTGTGTAKGVAVSDPLPAGSGTGVTWAIDGPPASPATCTITGSKPSQVLTCTDAALAAGASFTVHITATTSATECTSYDNTAHVTTTNDGSGSSEAKITCSQQVSQITPTQTTCAQFKSGTAGTLSAVNYATKVTTISSVNPGVLFYWVKVTVSSAGKQTFNILQSTTYSPTTGTGLFAKASGSFAYDGNCNTLSTTITAVVGTATGADYKVVFNAAAAGTYFIGIKYNTKTIVNSGPAATTTGTNYVYTFSTTGTGGPVGGSTSKLNLNHA
jgi:uncharacterized repeat protein (TIGR01451 family)